jgi:hypothetical protein
MQVNTKVQGYNYGQKEVVKNKEGYEVFNDELYRKFILQSITLNVSKNKFYFKAPEILDNYIETVRQMSEKDMEFTIKSISYFTQKFGRKLSPSVIVGYLMNESKNNSDINLSRYILNNFNDRPDKITNSLAIYKNIDKTNTLKNVPNVYKKVFKTLLENYKPITLKKFKMRKKDIKLADLIKLYRPKPLNDEMSKLYKSIIENTNFSKLTEQEHITTTLSSTKITDTEKKNILKESLVKIPINALIKNLKQFNDFSTEDKNIIKRRFKEIIKEKSFKYFNYADLFIPSHMLDSEMIDILNEVIYEYLKEFADVFDNEKEYTIIQDLSGSMYGSSWRNGNSIYSQDDGVAISAKFIASIVPTMNLDNLKIVLFSNEYIVLDRKKYGFYNVLKRFKTKPLDLYEKIVELFNTTIKRDFCAGTDLIDTLNSIDSQNYIVLTDEVTWNEKNKNSSRVFNQMVNNTKKYYFFYNTNYSDGKVITDSKNVVRLTGLSSSMFPMFSLYGGNISKLVQSIKETY